MTMPGVAVPIIAMRITHRAAPGELAAIETRPAAIEARAAAIEARPSPAESGTAATEAGVAASPMRSSRNNGRAQGCCEKPTQEK
jgi:hypothetical protein